jgi:hypothetical protein
VGGRAARALRRRRRVIQVEPAAVPVFRETPTKPIQVEHAAVPGDGARDAQVYGRALKKRMPLTLEVDTQMVSEETSSQLTGPVEAWRALYGRTKRYMRAAECCTGAVKRRVVRARPGKYNGHPGSKYTNKNIRVCLGISLLSNSLY